VGIYILNDNNLLIGQRYNPPARWPLWRHQKKLCDLWWSQNSRWAAINGWPHTLLPTYANSHHAAYTSFTFDDQTSKCTAAVVDLSGQRGRQGGWNIGTLSGGDCTHHIQLSSGEQLQLQCSYTLWYIKCARFNCTITLANANRFSPTR